MKKKTLKIIGIVFIVLIGVVLIFAKYNRITPLAWGHKEVNKPTFSDEAINGYDPVAYFTKGQAIKPDKSISYSWKNAIWYFSSTENLNLFKANPEKYVPQYGGYCAFAISKGFTANSDPTVFKIINNKLYLCSSKITMEDWVNGGEANLMKSNENWK